MLSLLHEAIAASASFAPCTEFMGAERAEPQGCVRIRGSDGDWFEVEVD
jgi:hypothetical protein